MRTVHLILPCRTASRRCLLNIILNVHEVAAGPSQLVVGSPGTRTVTLEPSSEGLVWNDDLAVNNRALRDPLIRVVSSAASASKPDSTAIKSFGLADSGAEWLTSTFTA